jgi:hypothetical protein
MTSAVKEHTARKASTGPTTGPADKIEHRNTADLKPYPNNPRYHSEEVVSELVASIREFGFTVPLVIDAQGNIIAGHARHEAAKRIGLQSVPCVVVPDDWDETKSSLYRIVDNSIPTHSRWHPQLLLSEIENLKLSDWNLSLATPDIALQTFNIEPGALLAFEGVSMIEPTPASPRVPKTKTTIFVVVDKGRADDARTVIAKALDRAKIPHSL